MLAISLFAGGVGSNAARADIPNGDTTIAGGCPTGDLIPVQLAPYACWVPGGDGPNQGHFWMWHYAPETCTAPDPQCGWPRPGGPVQPSQIAADGSFDKSYDATLEWIWAMGGRAQAVDSGPANWDSASAKEWVSKVKQPNGLSALDYVTNTLKSNCFKDDVERAARTAYTLHAIASETIPEATTCDLNGTVAGSNNAATGQYGPSLNSTIWSVFYLHSVSQTVDPKTSDFIKGQALPGGGWGDGGRLDEAQTSYAVMALIADPLVSVKDPVIVSAMNALAADQNPDGGWGKNAAGAPDSDMLLSAPVSGAIRALEARGAVNTDDYFNLFKGGQTIDGQKLSGRLGIQWLLQNSMQNQKAKDATEAGFYCHASGASAADAADLANNLCGFRSVYYAIFWHPIAPQSVQTQGCPDGEVQQADGTCSAKTTSAAPPATSVAANPAVTG